MIKASYDELIERVAKLSGLSRDEIERRVEAKRARLSGLISREGAIQVVAAELGLKFDNLKLKISDLLSGMKRVNVAGKIIKMFGIREFTKNNQQRKVATLMIGDDSGTIRVVLWDTNHIELIERGSIKEGNTIEITNATVRGSETTKELHLTSNSTISLSSFDIGNVKTEQELKLTSIDRLHANDIAKLRAVVVQVFDPFFFNVCPECKRKVVEENGSFKCETHGVVEPLERMLLSFVVDDGTASMRAICFTDSLLGIINSLNLDIGIDTLKEKEKIAELKQKLLGTEFWFSGRARRNQRLDALEFIVNEAEVVKPKELIEKLQ